MKLMIILVFSLIAQISSAGMDVSTTLVCQNKSLKVKITRRGSFFGSNHITIKRPGFLGETLVDEDYEQAWAPKGRFESEQIARKENPLFNKEFYMLLISAHSVVVETYVQDYAQQPGTAPSSLYVQIKSSQKVVRFDLKSECQKSQGL